MVKIMKTKDIIMKLSKLSKKALKHNEMPVSAIIVKDNKIIASAYNKKNISNCCFYHAEILCILKASKKLKKWNLNGCILYVVLEPCDMCKRVIEESRIDIVYYFLAKGNITNKYNKTKYEQLYGCECEFFKENIKNFFEILRK